MDLDVCFVDWSAHLHVVRGLVIDQSERSIQLEETAILLVAMAKWAEERPEAMGVD